MTLLLSEESSGFSYAGIVTKGLSSFKFKVLHVEDASSAAKSNARLRKVCYHNIKQCFCVI